jgi:molecular chaperone GrpE
LVELDFDTIILFLYNVEVMAERDDNDIKIETTEAEENDIEDTDLEGEEERSTHKLKKLQEKLKICEKEKMTALEDLQRARADFLNARRRLDEEKLNDRERARLQHVEELLPLCDSFEMALNDRAFQELPDNLKKGVLGMNMQLSSILKGYGVEEFGMTGDKFDPEIHEAMAEDGDGNTVKSVLQRGYRLKDRIVRPAKVVVG